MPCNQFGAQEPGTEAEIAEFVRSKYDVTFAKIEVNGSGTCELSRSLKAEKPGDIAWNFTKFLVNGKGKVVERFEPKVTPEEMESRIRELLGA